MYVRILVGKWIGMCIHIGELTNDVDEKSELVGGLVLSSLVLSSLVLSSLIA